LDISDGDKNNLASPFVHVEAKIPVPSSLKVDASMSEWPNGSAGLAAAVQAKLRAMTGIEQVTTKAGVSHVVEVSAGDLEVGPVREMYATKVSLQVSMHPLKTAKAGDAAFQALLAAELQKLAASKAGVAKEDVTFTCKDVPAGGKNVDCTGDFRAKGTSVANTKVSEWETKMMPMSREFQQSVLTKHKADIDGDTTKFIVLVGIGSVANVPDSIDMDLVIHGIEYSEIPTNRKRLFLKDLSGKIQTAVQAKAANAKITAVQALIRTVFTATSDTTLNVRVQVPVTDPAQFPTAADVTGVATVLEQKKADILEEVQRVLQLWDQADFVASWTNKAIVVQAPGAV